MSDGDVSLTHLSESVVLEKLVPYLAEFDDPKAYFVKDKNSAMNPEDVVSVFEMTDAERKRGPGMTGAATGWSLLDDDFEFCMMDEVGLSRFAGKTGVIDYTLAEHISPSALYFVEPRLCTIYHLQWKRIIKSGNAQSVRFTHHGYELYSHMFPFMWRDETDEVSTSKDVPEFLVRMGIHRFGANRHLKYGERMNKCVMHTVSHYSQAQGGDEDLIDHMSIQYTANN